MPFKSEAQRKWMFSNEPEMAKRWAKHTPKGKKLPARIGKMTAVEHNGKSPLIGKKMADNGFSVGEARRIARVLGIDFSKEKFDVKALARGMNVELEHAKITKKDARKSALIAVDHLREKPNYYKLLERYVEKALSGPMPLLGKCSCDEPKKMIGKCAECGGTCGGGKKKLPMIGKADELFEEMPLEVRMLISQMPLEMQATSLGGAGSTDIRPSMPEMNYEVPSRHAGLCSTCDHSRRTAVQGNGVAIAVLACTALSGEPPVAPNGHCDLWTGGNHLLGKADAGLFIGPRGGKWADPQHTVPYREEAPKKPRTGVIELSDAEVREAVDRLTADLPTNKNGIVPEQVFEMWSPTTSAHARRATGEGFTIQVMVLPSHTLEDFRGVSGGYTTARSPGRTPSHRSIALRVAIKAWDKDALKKEMRSVLSHELTHASDPGLFLKEPRKATSKEDYYNLPHEVTASLQQIRRDLQDQPAWSYAKKALRRGERVDPVQWLETYSARWDHVGQFYTEKNKRRVYRAVASLLDGIAQDVVPMIGKAQNGAGPQPEYGTRQSMPDFQGIYNILPDKATQKKLQREVEERRRAGATRANGIAGFHGMPSTPVLRNREGAWSSQPARIPEKMSTKPVALPPLIFKMNPEQSRERLKRFKRGSGSP